MYCLKILVVVSFLGAVLTTDGPPIISNHQLTDSSSTGSGDMSSGILDLPGPNEAQDANAELNGTFKNSTTGVKKIEDVKIWFEDSQGNQLKTPTGGAPVSGLKTDGGSGTLSAAALVSTEDGVATFNLATGINRGAAIGYEAQVDHFAEPNNYKIRVAFSSKDALSSEHYELIGFPQFTSDDTKALVDGIAPTSRRGVIIGVRNADAGAAISKVRIEIVTGAESVHLTGARIRNGEDEPVPGAVVAVAADGKSITVSGLAIQNPQLVNAWIDLDEPYVKTTVFKVIVSY